MDTNLANKISKLTQEIHSIPKDSKNPHFGNTYFDINTMLEKLREQLHNKNLVLTQPIEQGKVKSVITDIETGECISSELEIPDIADPQKIGGCVTYFRRYTLQSLLALEAEDDDGNTASGKSEQNNNGQSKENPASEKQVSFIRNLIKNLDSERKKNAEEALENGITSKQAREWIDKLQKK